MKADELRFKVTNKDGKSTIISLGDLFGYEGEECGVFILDEPHISPEFRGMAINFNSGYSYKGINEELNFECINMDKPYMNDKSQNEIQKKVGYEPVRGKTANWDYWEGWCSNHDRRIEDATCSKCGYNHPTVYGSPDKLLDICPGCNSRMKKYGN